MLVLLEDAQASTFEPFSLTRPVCELRAGIEIIRARWERVAGEPARGFIGPKHLSSFIESGIGRLSSEEELPPGTIVANSRAVVSLAASLGNSGAWTVDGKVAAARLSSAITVEELARITDLVSLSDGSRAESLEGWWLEAAWDLVRTLGTQLNADIPLMVATLQGSNLVGSVLGSHPVFIEDGAQIEPYVIFETVSGPILIRRGATISAFTRIAGPCYIGEDSTIVGDRITGCSIGNVCKIRGEISNSIVLGHSNKGHTGFVGHSYLGRWVNLGAGTTTSNLKNTYGSVAVQVSGKSVDTGMQFLGTLFGDHVKTGIGTMLNTGSILCTGANVFGGRMPPKYVRPFAWGDGEPYDTYNIDRFLEVAARVMSRRHVPLTEDGRRQLREAHELAQNARSSTT
jgi:UDP-N-acetylglucosamine diphosphorylase / glucose-1-phosphate thymidylyltransferase / UDP-N-acetylgalactosamine diphosphorylase / glucosamine-1-phosphate N-acetyltransferase / galactosamine-1-phosphate N-acetyltransferase